MARGLEAGGTGEGALDILPRRIPNNSKKMPVTSWLPSIGRNVSIKYRLMANRNRPDSSDTRDITDIRV